MAPKIGYIALALAFASPIWSAASVSSTALIERDSTPGEKCHGQSCEIAALAGSSGRKYKAKAPPKDGSNAGDCCILSYNPSARHLLYQQNPVLKTQCKKRDLLFERDDTMFDEEEDDLDDIEERANCAPNTLIFAKGTDETGPLGNSVGPALQSGLDSAAPGQWSVRGVKWHNDQFGNFCLGLPGGKHAAMLLKKVHRNCPNSKIIMSGYSQGAMVVRNGIAYSPKKSHKKIKGVVTFGDPMRGAPIKKYHGPIKVYCAKGDRVCDGRDIISSAHLSYVGMDTSEAVGKIMELASK